ncbi:MAG: hypothetical protein OQK78_03785 [Gammaproteobacteria bacterium]|nr:hypothetical protein [Gammaproteobacteria bacterium]
MKWLKIIVCLFVMIFTASVANAIHLGDVTIKEIRVWDNRVLVKTNQPIIKAECATVDGYFSVNLDENHASNRKLSVLLTAQASQKIVNPNCTTTCESTWSSWLGTVTICDEVAIK